MEYVKLAELYETLEKTSKRLEKVYHISSFLKKCPNSELKNVVYLLQGKIFPAWDERTIGLNSKLILKSIAKASGEPTSKIEKLWVKFGDLGLAALEVLKNKKQQTLFSEKLSIGTVISILRKITETEGAGTVDRKISMVAKLLTSSTNKESKYIVRTVLGELRTGIQQGTLRDALIFAFLPKIIGVNYYCQECKSPNLNTKKCMNCNAPLETNFSKAYKPKICVMSDELVQKECILPSSETKARELYNKMVTLVQHAYDMSTDMGEIASLLKEKGLDGIKNLSLEVGKPIKVMLYLKAKNINDALNTVGKPAIIEKKFDGFRMQIHRKNDKVFLFTRRLENVTRQFPDVVEYVKKYIKSNNFIVDCEVLGIDPKTKKILPFQHISQRIKRKHNIAQMVKELPVKIVVFDAIMINGEVLLNQPLDERMKKLKSIIKNEKNKVELVEELVSGSEKQIEKFYMQALKEGHEGIMIKNMKGIYKPGARVGYGMKIKPVMEPLDLVIVGAEWGEGKRAKWLSSFTLACKDKDDLKEIGKVGTGIKEKSELGVSFAELTKLLKPLIIEKKGKTVKVKPKIIVEVHYEEIQKSPTYSSGFALRFPRVVRLRSDEKPLDEISTLQQVKRFYEMQK
ncbi:ATP-dependent DNA ligase [Candidatus Woesearchaeota archaeon]|nr:MAG: ATP-dependent DNA ligase [Candidatus Woesearchaeota archaeon]